jgi:hypothetical protein
MTALVSGRLEDDTEAAADARRARIRAASEAVGAYVAASLEAREFLEEWGTPRAAIS